MVLFTNEGEKTVEADLKAGFLTRLANGSLIIGFVRLKKAVNKARFLFRFVSERVSCLPSL